VSVAEFIAHDSIARARGAQVARPPPVGVAVANLSFFGSLPKTVRVGKLPARAGAIP